MVFPVPKALQKWHDHLKRFQEEHPELTWKQCMKEASKTYKKT